MFETRAVEKIKIRISFSITFSKNRAVYETVEEYCTAQQIRDDNMVHAHCLLDI